MTEKLTKEKSTGIDWYSIGVLWFSTLAVSGVIALYVMLIAWMNIKESDTDPVDRAALQAATALADKSVEDQTFGSLSLMNRENSRSFNTAVSLLRNCGSLARQLDLPVVKRALVQDMVRISELQNQFIARLENDIAPGGSVFAEVKRTIEAGLRGKTTLKELHLRLGYLDQKLLDVTSIPALSEDQGKTYLKAGKIAALQAVPIKESEQVYFFAQEPPLRKIEDNKVFIDWHKEEFKNRRALPSALLLEARLETGSNGGSLLLAKRRVCVSLGSKADTRNNQQALRLKPLCLVLAFPHGRLSHDTSLRDLLQRKDWLNKGNWTQYRNGNQSYQSESADPAGTARLVGNIAIPEAPLLEQMSPGEALSLILYEFVKHQERPIEQKNLLKMVNASFAEAPKAEAQEQTDREDDNNELDYLSMQERVANQANTSLVQESDARTFAYLYRGGAREKGLKAVINAFSDGQRRFPNSTLPMVLYQDGSVGLPGRKEKYDAAASLQDQSRKLVIELLTDIYNTNLSANETMTTARVMQANAYKKIKESNDRIFLLNQDLIYLTGIKQDDKTKEEISLRRIKLENEKQKQLVLNKVVYLSTQAQQNAQLTASTSFEVGSHLFLLAAGGIHRLQAGDKPAYLLGKRYVFKPVLQSLVESELYEEAEKLAKQLNQPKENQNSFWLKTPDILKSVTAAKLDADHQISIEGKSLSDLIAEENAGLARPETLVIDSRALSGDFPTLVFGNYPLASSRHMNGELIYYCQTACKTKETVFWSSLARDYLKRSRLARESELYNIDPNWCKTAVNANLLPEEAGCPQLGGEWQLRAPLVHADKSLQEAIKGATLTDPKSGQRILQIPAAGPDLF